MLVSNFQINNSATFSFFQQNFHCCHGIVGFHIEPGKTGNLKLEIGKSWKVIRVLESAWNSFMFFQLVNSLRISGDGDGKNIE